MGGNSDVELLYFPIHGRGLVARMILDYGKVDYHNNVINFPEFMALKPTLPLGQLPVLKIDGVMYCQTQAINAYCGKLPTKFSKQWLSHHLLQLLFNHLRILRTRKKPN